MKNRLLQIANGDLISKKAVVSVNSEGLPSFVHPNAKVSYALPVNSENHIPAYLYNYSTNLRVKVPEKLTLLQTGKLVLNLSTENLQPGDRIEGKIVSYYNGGVNEIPFSFTVQDSKPEEDRMDFKTKEDFFSWASENEEEAVRFFTSSEFPKVTFMQDLQIQARHDLFRSGIQKDGGMWEFFSSLGLKKKEAVSANPKTEFIPSEAQRELVKNATIRKNFLAYERLKRTGGSTASIQKDALSEFRKYPGDLTATLWYAYLMIEKNELDDARIALLTVQGEIQRQKNLYPGFYVLFVYLVSKVSPKEGIEERIRMMLKSYLESNPRDILLILLMVRLYPKYEANPEATLDFLTLCSLKGCNNSLLYQEILFLWKKDPILPSKLSSLELHVILYGLRHHMIEDEELMGYLRNREPKENALSLYLLVLKEGYKSFRNSLILSTLVTFLIREKDRTGSAFRWYQEAVREKLTVAQLNEYYVYTSPEGMILRYPESVIDYFAYPSDLSDSGMEKLYGNVMKYYRDSPVFRKEYEERIFLFGKSKLSVGAFSEELLPIYEWLLSTAVIDADNAPQYLKLFSICRMTGQSERARKVYIYYPEMGESDVYSLNPAKRDALIPVYSEDVIPALEDSYGRKYFDPDIRLEPVFSDEEKMEQCIAATPDFILAEIRSMNRMIEKGVRDADCPIVTEFLLHRKLHPYYQKKLLARVFEFLTNGRLKNPMWTELAEKLSRAVLSREEKAALVTALVRLKQYEPAMEIVANSTPEKFSEDALLKLCDAAFRIPRYENSPELLELCQDLFIKGIANAKMKDYLGEYWTGSIPEMVTLLKAIHTKSGKGKRLLEKVILASFYAGEYTYIDYLFECYCSNPAPDDTVLLAFLSLYGDFSLRKKKKLPEKAESMMLSKMSQLSAPALLSLTESLSKRISEATAKELSAAEKLLSILAEKNLALACISKFEKMMTLPFEFRNRTYLEYRDFNAKSIAVAGRIYPGEILFHRVMNEVYPGIFVQAFILYKHEWMEHTFLVYREDGREEIYEGKVISKESNVKDAGLYYENIITLEKKMENPDIGKTAEYLRSLMLKNNMVERLFSNEPMKTETGTAKREKKNDG